MDSQFLRAPRYVPRCGVPLGWMPLNTLCLFCMGRILADGARTETRRERVRLALIILSLNKIDGPGWCSRIKSNPGGEYPSRLHRHFGASPVEHARCRGGRDFRLVVNE